MNKLAITLSKGGVGKTTTCVNLAAALAAKERRVLVVDTDTQGQAAVLLGLEADGGLAGVMQGRLELEAALKPARPNLWLLSGGAELSGVLHSISRTGDEAHWTLSRALAPLEGLFDLVLIDTAPGWDPLLINVLFYADRVMCPVSCEILALRGLAEFNKKLAKVNEHHSVELRYILPTFVDWRVRKTVEILEQLHRHVGDRLCHPIHYNVKLSEAAGFGRTIMEYAPYSRGARDYAYLAEKVDSDVRT